MTARRITVFVLVLLALMVLRIVDGGLTPNLFDGSALLESSFFAALASYFAGRRCGTSSCTPSPASP